jgi:hypothetical protein
MRSFAALAAVAMSSPGSWAADPGVLLAGVGMYDIIPNDNRSVALHVQYRFADGFGAAGAFRGFKPLVGGMVNSDQGAFGFAGFAAPLRLTRTVELEPSAGVGAHHQGDSTFLGGTFEFHLGLGVAKSFGDGLRLGVNLTHISNANLHAKNRGTNVLMATVGWEFP